MAKMGFEKTPVHCDWHNQLKSGFGYTFKSKTMEYPWARYLELLKNSPDDKLYAWQYEPETFVEKKMRWNKIRKYTPDFMVWYEQWHSPKMCITWYEWHECKTSLTQKDVGRFRWFRADYPEERMVLVLKSMPKRSIKQKRLLDNAKKYVDEVIIAGPIFRKLGL